MRLRNKKTGEIIEWENPLQYKLGKEYHSIKEFVEDWEDCKPEFDWKKAKENLIETDCGITLCRDDYTEGDKKHFTFDEALEIEKEAKKHGFRLPTVVDFEKLYAFYGLGEDGKDTPQRFKDELGFTDAAQRRTIVVASVGTYGYYWSSSIYSTDYSYILLFNTSNVSPQDYDGKYFGFAVKFIYDEKLLEKGE